MYTKITEAVEVPHFRNTLFGGLFKGTASTSLKMLNI
jgi:hypothetical protein